MNTAPADERLSAYLDGELTESEVERLEAELARDAQLRAQLELLRGVVRMLHEDGPTRAPLGFHHAVMARIDAEHPVVEPWWAWLRRPFGVPIEGMAVAAVALLVLAVVGLPGQQTSPLLEEPTWRDVESPEEAAAPAAVKLPSQEKGMEAETKGLPPRPSTKSAESKPAPKQKAAPEASEEEESGKDPVLRALPNGYVVVTEDVRSMRSLLALVGRLGGTVTTPDGAAVAQATLEQSETSVIIRIPSDAMTDFQAGLQELGLARATFDDDALFAGPEVTLQVTLRLAGGAVGEGGTDTDPAAARKKRAPAPQDMLEIDEGR